MDPFQRWNYIPETMFDVHLPKEEKAEFKSLLKSLRKTCRKSVAIKPKRYDDLLLFNKSGSKPPIFWCFNNWAEPHLLAHQLSNDQPLIAAHSLHMHEDRWLRKARYTEPLANHYLESALRIVGEQEFTIGGNCQAGPIAESFAIQLAQNSGRYSKLVTLDYIPRRSYQGPTLMLFGSNSLYNPFLREDLDPASYLKQRLRSFKWEFLDASHGSYFREPTVTKLKNHILGFSLDNTI